MQEPAERGGRPEAAKPFARAVGDEIIPAQVLRLPGEKPSRDDAQHCGRKRLPGRRRRSGRRARLPTTTTRPEIQFHTRALPSVCVCAHAQALSVASLARGGSSHSGNSRGSSSSRHELVESGGESSLTPSVREFQIFQGTFRRPPGLR